MKEWNSLLGLASDDLNTWTSTGRSPHPLLRAGDWFPGIWSTPPDLDGVGIESAGSWFLKAGQDAVEVFDSNFDRKVYGDSSKWSYGGSTSVFAGHASIASLAEKEVFSMGNSFLITVGFKETIDCSRTLSLKKGKTYAWDRTKWTDVKEIAAQKTIGSTILAETMKADIGNLENVIKKVREEVTELCEFIYSEYRSEIEKANEKITELTQDIETYKMKVTVLELEAGLIDFNADELKLKGKQGVKVEDSTEVTIGGPSGLWCKVAGKKITLGGTSLKVT